MTPLLLPLLLAIAPPGIPRQLAIDRAQNVSNVSYKLAYTLQAHSDSTAGHEELTFALRQSGPLLLDFREGVISKMLVNGQPTPPVSENGHVVLPPLKAGANKIEIDFSAPVAPAGKAITATKTKTTAVSTSTPSSYQWTRAWPSRVSISPTSRRASRWD